MKVLVVTTLFPNSLQVNNAVFVKHRMKAVQESGAAEVRVVAPVPYCPPLPFGEKRRVFAQVPEFEIIDGLQVWHPRYFMTPKIGMSLYGIWIFMSVLPLIRRIYKEWRFDVIDAHYLYPDGFAALLLARVLRVPLVVSARGTDANLFPNLLCIRPLIKCVLRGADRLISVCHSLADIMIKHGATRSRIAVIPNGIDSSQFEHREVREARSRLGLAAEAKILLFVGSLIERKGVHLLLDSLAALHQDGKLDFKTYLVGEGPLRKKLEERISAAGLQGAVTLVGEVDNRVIGDWYYAADVSFLGSIREGWPNVVSESLACGTPVVATPVNGIPEIITSEEYGYIVERDPVRFAHFITRAMNRQWDRDAIRRYGRSRTWETVAVEVEEVLTEAVRGFGACWQGRPDEQTT